MRQPRLSGASARSGDPRQRVVIARPGIAPRATSADGQPAAVPNPTQTRPPEDAKAARARTASTTIDDDTSILAGLVLGSNGSIATSLVSITTSSIATSSIIPDEIFTTI